MINLLIATLVCTGIAPTTPQTDIEVTIKPADVKYSTIRYGLPDGSGYIQSIGHMYGTRAGSRYTFKSGDGPNATILVLTAHGEHIHDAKFSHYISGMKDSPVDCIIDDDGSSEHDH